jgi:hypothetical protein
VQDRGNHHSDDDVAEFVAVTSLLGSEVPSDFASLVMPSNVMTGRLCCRRWATGEDCVRPWCGPLPPATPPGVDEPERKLRLAPAAYGGWRPSVCERPCVGWRDVGTARGPSGGPDRDSLDLGADAERPFVLLSAAGSVTPASRGACAVQEGAWIESAKVLPASMGGVREGAGAGSSEVESEGCGGVSSGGVVIEGSVRSEGREGSGACEPFGG